jgi:hypothetical protein
LKKKEFSKACDIVENKTFGLMFKNSGKFRGRSFFLLIKNWKWIIGRDLSEKIHINSLQNDILYIAVPDSSWMQNLMFMKEDIKKKVNEFDSKIKEIRFVVDKKSVIKWEKTPSLCLDDIKVNQDKIDRIDEMLENIKDNDLKAKLKELYIKKEKFQNYTVETGLKICKKCKSVYNDNKCPYCKE